MVSFEIFVKAMPPSLSELKVLPSFCFAFEIPDNRAVTNNYLLNELHIFPSRKYLNKGVEVHNLLHTVHNSICTCIPANS